MRKRAKVLLLAGCLAAAVALTLYGIRAQEPHYQGRSLTEWLLLSDQRPDSDPAELQQATQAVRTIGTNALPSLLRWLHYDDAPPNQFLVDLDQLAARVLGRSVREVLTRETPQVRCQLVPRAFSILGPQGAPAIPDLAPLLWVTNQCEMSTHAAACLVGIGTPALPTLLSALADPGFPDRPMLAIQLGFMRRTAGTNVVQAVPLLAQCATNADPHLAIAAINALGRIGLGPDTALPPIIRGLGSPHQGNRLWAAQALFKFGAQARPALPALQTALHDPDPDVRAAVTNTLFQLAAEPPSLDDAANVE